jgi:transcriptional regulator with XRE-family HTH domain
VSPSHPSAASREIPLLASFLKKTREERGLSLREVATKAEDLGELLPFATLARIERGEVEPRISKLSALLKIYQVPAAVVAEYLDMDERARAAEQTALPDDIGALVELAQRALKQGDYQRGSLIAQRIFAYDPFDDELGDYHAGLRAIAIGFWNAGLDRVAQDAVGRMLCDEARIGRDNLLAALIMQGRIWGSRASHHTALAFYERVLALLTPDDNEGLVANVHHNIAVVHYQQGNAASATRSLDVAFPIYEKRKDIYNLANAWTLRAKIARLNGDGEAAVRHARMALGISEKHPEAGGHLPERHCSLGQELRLSKAPPGETLHHLEAALSMAIEKKLKYERFHAHYQLYLFYEEQGESARAALELENAKHFVTGIDEKSPETEHIRTLIKEERAGGAHVSAQATSQGTRKMGGARPRRRTRGGERPGA